MFTSLMSRQEMDDFILAYLSTIHNSILGMGVKMSTFSNDLTSLVAAADANKAAVAQVSTLVQSQTASIAELQAQIAALQAGQAVTPDQLAALESAITELQGDNTTLTGMVPPVTPPATGAGTPPAGGTSTSSFRK